MKSVAKIGVLFLLVAIFATLSSCRSSRGMESRSHYQTDSASTEIRWRYIPIFDTVPVYIPVEKQTSVGEDSSHLETDFATSDAYIDSLGKLHHSLENKPRKIDIPVKGSALVSDTNHYESHAKVDTIRVPEPYPVYVEKELTDWQKVLMWIGRLSIIAIIGVVVWKTRRWLFNR